MSSLFCFFFSSRRRHTRLQGDWSSDVCSSDLSPPRRAAEEPESPTVHEEGASQFQQVHAFNVQRLPVARDQDDDSQAHGRFRRRHHDHKQNKHLAIELAESLAEGDKRQIHSVQHQLDGHENRDDVALEDKRNDAQPEQDGAEDQVVVRRDHPQLLFSRCASTSAPRIATRIRNEVSSNGYTNSRNSIVARPCVEATLPGRTPVVTGPDLAIVAARNAVSATANGIPAVAASLEKFVRSSTPAFSSMITSTKSTMIAPAYTMICTAATNSAPRRRYRPASATITTISDSAL